MPRKAPTLTKSQVKQIRANLARKASQCGNRLVANGLGELKDNEGNPIDLTAGQIKSLVAALQFVLPAQQELDEVTEQVVDYEGMQAAADELRQQILATATPDDIEQAKSKLQ